MTHPAYIRDKARSLRTEKHLSIDEIAERLALPKTTIYYWVRDLPLGRPRSNPGQVRGNIAMQANCAFRRVVARLDGRLEFARLAADP
jgi:excisionase family DNA binding protein